MQLVILIDYSFILLFQGHKGLLSQHKVLLCIHVFLLDGLKSIGSLDQIVEQPFHQGWAFNGWIVTWGLTHWLEIVKVVKFGLKFFESGLSSDVHIRIYEFKY